MSQNSLIGTHCRLDAGVFYLLRKAESPITQYQVMFDVPKGASVTRFLEDYKFQLQGMDMSSVILHGPLWWNFCKGSTHWLVQRSVKELQDYVIVCSELGIRKIVVHVGARWSDKDGQAGIPEVSRERAFHNWLNTANSLVPMLDKYGVMLCFENTPGSKLDRYMGYTEEVMKIKEMIAKPDQIGYCYDTLHSYVNGERYFLKSHENEFIDIIENADVIHFNGNNPDCTFGNHRDRHAQGNINSALPDLKDRLELCYKYAKVPMILERGDHLYAMDEKLEWCKNHNL